MDPQITAQPNPEPARDVTGGRAQEPSLEEIARWKLAQEAQQARAHYAWWENEARLWAEGKKTLADELPGRRPVYRGARLTRHNLPHPSGLNRATRRARGL